MKRQIIAVLGGMLLLGSVVQANASTQLMTIGKSPFYRPPLKSSTELKNMVQTHAKEVEKGFALAGRTDLYQPFMEQLPKADIKTVEFAKGSHFEWMFFKKNGNGKVRIARDVTWINPKKTFPGFEFTVTKDNTEYTFVVPLGCGNVALMNSREIAVAPPPQNQDPQCSMTVSSVRAFCGEIITVDASASKDPDGTISKMTISFVDDQGNVVSEQVVDGGLVGQATVPCGTHKMKVTLQDNEGAVSAAGQCEATVTGVSRLKPVVDLGYYRQLDPGHFLFGRAGMEYMINDSWSVLGMIGGAGKIHGIDGAHALMLDMLAEYKFADRYFIDLGVGGWITDGEDDRDTEDSQLDLIGGFGARVYGEPDAFNASVFAEVRNAPDEELMEYGRFGLGVRFRF